MTPSEWINIKTKFGNEVSTNFGYGEKPKIISDIGMMVMLSHIRLLLLGYGIRLAYVTLEEKLKGYFVIVKIYYFMKRNFTLCFIRRCMSHFCKLYCTYLINYNFHRSCNFSMKITNHKSPSLQCLKCFNCRSIAKLCNNELIRKAQDLMSKHLSHGAPCPKLSKLIELLKDHFGI